MMLTLLEARNACWSRARKPILQTATIKRSRVQFDIVIVSTG
jgi:hypothetical protein